MLCFFAVHSSGWLTKETELFQVKLATMLSSAFFIFLWLYWLLVYWWSRQGLCSHQRYPDSAPLAILGLLLILYFVGVMVMLLDVVIRKLDLVFGSSHVERSGKEDVEIKLIRANFILMIICFHVYAAFFLAIKLEQITARRWRGGKVPSCYKY